jgi:hypothetical protein
MLAGAELPSLTWAIKGLSLPACVLLGGDAHVTLAPC